MTRPCLRVRVLGYPPVTFGLLAGFAVVFWQWWGGQTYFPVALLALFAGVRTVQAYDQKREYEDWQLEEEGAAREPRLISLGGVMGMLLALVAVCVTTANLPRFPVDSIGANALGGIRWMALLYLLIAVVRLWRAWRRRPKPREAEVVPAAPEPVFVSWMLDVPESSPSRADAERELPEYLSLIHISEPTRPY